MTLIMIISNIVLTSSSNKASRPEVLHDVHPWRLHYIFLSSYLRCLQVPYFWTSVQMYGMMELMSQWIFLMISKRQRSVVVYYQHVSVVEKTVFQYWMFISNLKHSFDLFVIMHTLIINHVNDVTWKYNQ